MRAAGLRAKAVRGYRAKANIHHLYARHPKPALGMSVTAPNQAWVGDITFLKVGTHQRIGHPLTPAKIEIQGCQVATHIDQWISLIRSPTW